MSIKYGTKDITDIPGITKVYQGLELDIDVPIQARNQDRPLDFNVYGYSLGVAI